MDIIRIWDNGLSPAELDDIAARLRDGQIMIWPTDTLYGIACDALCPKAVEHVCRIKKLNPEKNTLSIVCADISMASEYARIDNPAYRLMRDLTPGPFTFVLRAASRLPRAFRSRKTAGIRIPSLDLCRRLAERLGNPLMNTSIDFDDRDYAVSPELIAEAYDQQADFMLSGPDGLTEPSTVIDCTAEPFVVLRQGAGEYQP